MTLGDCISVHLWIGSQNLDKRGAASNQQDSDSSTEEVEKFSYDSLYEKHGNDGIKDITGFTHSEFTTLYETISPLILPRGRGRKDMPIRDGLALFLAWATSGMTYNEISIHFGVSRSTLFRTVESVIRRTKNALVQTYIPSTIDDATADGAFVNFPDAFGAVDATVIEISRPYDSENQKKYYCGKHKFHCVKFQCLINPDGQAVHISQVVEGKQHDKKLFDQSGLTKFLTTTKLIAGHLVSERKIILCDSGYTGINLTHPEAIITRKRRAGEDLSAEDEEFNRILSSDRIIVENYFGRMKIVFGVMHYKFRCTITMLSDLIPMIVALTNYHIQNHPLRRRD